MKCACIHCETARARARQVMAATPRLAEGTERNPRMADGTAQGNERSPVSGAVLLHTWLQHGGAYSDSLPQERAEPGMCSSAREESGEPTGQDNASGGHLGGRDQVHAAGSVDSGCTAPSTKPCCRRTGRARWCALDDGHQGECDGPGERAVDEAQFYTRVGGGK